MAVSKRTRFEVLRRDDHTCQYCGEAAPNVVLHVDHVIPVSLGGSDSPDNLVAACKDCNVGKASSNPDAPIVAEVAARAADFAVTAKQAAAMMRDDLDKLNDYVEEFTDQWDGWKYSHTDEPIPLPEDYRATLAQWWKAGLPGEAIEDAVNVTMKYGRAKDPFRYFCGVVWRKLDEYELMSSARGVEDPAVYTESEVDDARCIAHDSGVRHGYQQATIRDLKVNRAVDFVANHIDGTPGFDRYPIVANFEFGGVRIGS